MPRVGPGLFMIAARQLSIGPRQPVVAFYRHIETTVLNRVTMAEMLLAARSGTNDPLAIDGLHFHASRMFVVSEEEAAAIRARSSVVGSSLRRSRCVAGSRASPTMSRHGHAPGQLRDGTS